MEILIVVLLLVLVAMDVFLLIKVEFKREQMTAKPLIKQKLTKEEKDKQEQIKKSFENLMNYDETTARRRK
jgi:hypothetical protein